MSHKICISQLTIKCLNIISKIKHIGVKQHFSDTLLAEVKKLPMRSNTMFLKKHIRTIQNKKERKLYRGKAPKSKLLFL